MVNLDPKNILSALRRHLQEGEWMTSVVPMSIGHSNETYRLEGLDLVLRMPPSQAALVEPGHGMRGQFELYAVLRGLPGAPPVPAVRYLCEDEAVLGAPFYLMKAVNGEPFTECEVAPQLAATDGSGRAAFTQQWCEAIVSVDRQPPLDVLGPPLSITAELDRWRDVASAAGNNELVKHFGSLYDNVPPPTGVPTLVHGDPKPANMLWRYGELVSLLDWEMSLNGDPAWDLGYMLIFLPGDLHP